jgi:hypothetical protein
MIPPLNVRSKKVELLAKVHDHAIPRLQVAHAGLVRWIKPLDFALRSSANKSNDTRKPKTLIKDHAVRGGVRRL